MVKVTISIGLMLFTFFMTSLLLERLSPPQGRFLCVDFDGKSSYTVRERWLWRNSPMLKGEGYINGLHVVLYIPKSNIVGCVEIEDAQ